MIEIYHNPRCSTSRDGLLILEASGKDFKIIKYLETPLNFERLQQIIKLLKIKPITLIRQMEPIWKANFKDKKLSDKRLIQLMIEHPKLIERPIVINDYKAAIGRPPTNIRDIL